MTDPSRLIVVGQIAGAFGVRGEAKVRSYTEDPDACFDYGPLLDADGKVLLTPVSVRPLKDVYGVVTEETRTREEWEDLKGTFLHVPRGAMPEPDDEDEVYVVDLIGCTIVHADGRQLGVVRDVRDFGAGDLLEVQPPEGPVYFLPFTRDAVPDVNLSARILTAAAGDDLLPESLHRQSAEG